MTDSDSHSHPDSAPAPDPHPDSAPDRPADDDRSDIEQAVVARAGAVAHGEGGAEATTFTATGLRDAPAGTGGVTRNQDDDAQ